MSLLTAAPGSARLPKTSDPEGDGEAGPASGGRSIRHETRRITPPTGPLTQWFSETMNRSIASVKNPLTVIAIFAGLAEVAGTAVLPFVGDANQLTYIWFLMLFPSLLVVLFFVTLNFNPKVLYAPSDFADEKNYMDLFRPFSTSERIQKLEGELLEQEEASSPTSSDEQSVEGDQDDSQVIVSSKERLVSLMKQGGSSRHILAESLVIDRLAKEFGTAPRRDVALRNRYGSQLFDAAFEDRRGLVLVETKFFTERSYPRRARETLEKIQASFFALPEDARKNSRFILAIAYDMPKVRAARIERELMSMLGDFRMPTEVRMYDLQELIDGV